MSKAVVEKSLSGLKGQFEQLQASGQCSGEVIVLFQSLLALFETVPMMLMEKNTPKTPANSGLPSSTVSPDRAARSKTRSDHQRRKQSHDECGNARLEQTMEISPVEHGQHGDHDWTRIAVQDHERRALMEVVLVTRKHHDRCRNQVLSDVRQDLPGLFPDRFHGPLQSGTGGIALTVNLPVSQMVSVRRTAQLLKSMTGRPISASTLIERVLRIHRALQEREPVATRKLLQMPVLHVDETSIRINQKNYWIHTCTSGDPGLMPVHAKRGQEAIDEIGISRATEVLGPTTRKKNRIIRCRCMTLGQPFQPYPMRSLDPSRPLAARSSVHHGCAPASLGKTDGKTAGENQSGSCEKRDQGARQTAPPGRAQAIPSHPDTRGEGIARLAGTEKHQRQASENHCAQPARSISESRKRDLALCPQPVLSL